MKASEIEVGAEYAVTSSSDDYHKVVRGARASRARVRSTDARYRSRNGYGGTRGIEVEYLDDKGNVRQHHENYWQKDAPLVDYVEIVQARAVRCPWAEYAKDRREYVRQVRAADKAKVDGKARALAKHAELIRLLDAKGVRRPTLMRDWTADGDTVTTKPYYDGDTDRIPWDAEKPTVTVDVGWLVEALGGLPDPDAEPVDDDEEVDA